MKVILFNLFLETRKDSPKSNTRDHSAFDRILTINENAEKDGG